MASGGVLQGFFAARTVPAGRHALALPPDRLRLAPRGAGERLPAAVQARMEALLGAGLDDVRIHAGPQAAALGAHAVTAGADIYFAPGRYAPDSAAGRLLLAHELTHVLQQRRGRVRNPFAAGLALVQDPALEAEAERNAGRVAVLQPSAAAPHLPAAAPGNAAAGRPPAAGPAGRRAGRRATPRRWPASATTP